ncbi:MAG: ATP-binding protein [bacterium]
MRAKWGCLLFLGFAMASPALAQPNYLWQYWTAKDGFEESYARDITFSPAGNVWIASGETPSISRYDGYSFQDIPLPCEYLTTQENRDRQIWSMYWKDKKGDTLGGFQQYLNNQWVQYEVDVFEPGIYPVFFLPATKDQLIFLLPDRLMVFNAAQRDTREILNVAKTRMERFSEMIFSSSSGIWITGERGAVRVLGEGNTIGSPLEWREHIIPDDMLLHDLRYPYEGKKGELYETALIADTSQDVFVRLDGSSWKKIATTEKDSLIGVPGIFNDYWLIRGIYAWQTANWIYSVGKIRTQYFGLNPFSISLVRDTDEITIKPNHVLSGILPKIALDKYGAVWFRTIQGFARCAPSLWVTPEGLIKNDMLVYGIQEDKQNRLWFHCKDKLIVLNHNKWKEYASPSSRLRVGAPGILSDQRIALSTWGENLLFNPNTEQYETLVHPDGRGFGFVKQKSDGVIWIETGDAQKWYIELFDGIIFKTLYEFPPEEEGVDWIHEFYETQDGLFWVGGSAENGLAQIQDGKMKIFSAKDKYLGSRAICIMEVEPGKIWYGSKHGIYEYDGVTFSVVNTNFEYVNKMIRSKDGSIWAAANDGVHRYRNGSWVSYSVDEGLPDAAANAVYEDSQGRIWVGTTSGISVYNPQADTDPPKVFMVEDKNVRTIAPDGEAQFVFTGIDKWKYTEKERLLYSHRIYQAAWSPFNSDTVATVSGMDSGNHVFEVRSMDRNWNVSEPVSWEFTVLRPWYRMPAFLAIITISTMVIFMLAWKLSNRHFQLRRAYVQVQEANVQLQQLDQMKSTFVSQASHDLRTPLTAIKSSLDNLKRGVGGGLNEKQDKVVERASHSVDRLTHLINDVLDINRIESGRMVLEKSDINFGAVIQNAVYENHPAADQKRIILSVHGLEDQYPVHVDSSKMERVVGELIGNAIKYTHEGGQVTVTLKQDDNRVVLSVKDTGIGMTPEECAKIWDRFYRTRASQEMAKGSGLGLSIAKELIDLHEGTLTVESEAGIGTTFRLSLPIRVP